VTASGRLGLSGYGVNGQFAFSSSGGLSGSGSLSFAGQSFDVTVSLPVSGSPTLSGSVSISGSFSGFSVSGTVALGYDDGVEAEFSGRISKSDLSKSVHASVSASGCVSVGGFPYWCPTLTNPTKTCTKSISVCIL
jgi:hypothetical protein